MLVDFFSEFVFTPPECGWKASAQCLLLIERERNRERERSGGIADGISLIQYLLLKQGYFL